MYNFTSHACTRLEERVGISKDAALAALTDSRTFVRIKTEMRFHDGTYAEAGQTSKIDHLLFLDRATGRYAIARVERKARVVLTVISLDEQHADIRAKVYGSEAPIERGMQTIGRRCELIKAPVRYSAEILVIFANGKRRSKKLGASECNDEAGLDAFIQSATSVAKDALVEFAKKHELVSADLTITDGDGQVLRCIEL